MDVKGGEAVHLNLVNEEVRFIRWNVLALIPGEVMPRIGPIDKRIGTDLQISKIQESSGGQLVRISCPLTLFKSSTKEFPADAIQLSANFRKLLIQIQRAHRDPVAAHSIGFIRHNGFIRLGVQQQARHFVLRNRL